MIFSVELSQPVRQIATHTYTIYVLPRVENDDELEK